jgi:hypothetical protein
VNRGKRQHGKRITALAALALFSVVVCWAGMPQGMGKSACRVYRYYQALEGSGMRTGPVERLVFSVILATSEQTKGGPGQAASSRNPISFS